MDKAEGEASSQVYFKNADLEAHNKAEELVIHMNRSMLEFEEKASKASQSPAIIFIKRQIAQALSNE
jgi:hypothetical protein